MAKVLVSMSDDFLNKIDSVASNEQRTRSELIREALRTYFRRVSMQQSQRAADDAKTLEDLIG